MKVNMNLNASRTSGWDLKEIERDSREMEG